MQALMARGGIASGGALPRDLGPGGEPGSVRTAAEGREELERALHGALAQAGGADSALLFVTPGGVLELPEILDIAVAILGTEAVVGATAHGVLASGQELEGTPSVSVLVQSGIESEPFLISDLRRDGAGVGEEIAAHLGGVPRPGDLVIVLPDSYELQPEAFLAGIRDALGEALVVGAGASDPIADQPLQWSGRRVENGALAGMVLRAEKAARIGITQACRPVTDLMTVTRARGNWIVELDGRPALDVYSEVARAPLAEDLRRAAAHLLVALPKFDEHPLRPGGYVVRNIAGHSEEQRAFAIPEPVTPGMKIALATREPQTARRDLKAMLEGVGTEESCLGLYFNGCSRGASLFGVEGLEAAYLEKALGSTPVAGMFGSCEFGPIGASAASTELLTHTGVLALL